MHPKEALAHSLPEASLPMASDTLSQLWSESIKWKLTKCTVVLSHTAFHVSLPNHVPLRPPSLLWQESSLRPVCPLDIGSLSTDLFQAVWCIKQTTVIPHLCSARGFAFHISPPFHSTLASWCKGIMMVIRMSRKKLRTASFKEEGKGYWKNKEREEGQADTERYKNRFSISQCVGKGKGSCATSAVETEKVWSLC